MSRPLAWSGFVPELRDLLREKALDTPLYLVGGVVRDACLGAPTTDIDIAVAGDAVRVARQTADWLAGDIYVMDRERGVARVFVNRDGAALLLDFARFRGDSLADDLGARDFTINAMAVDLLGDLSHLIDPLDGEADLRARILRQCSPTSFADDPVRLLRALRQSVQLGLKIHPQTLAGLRKHVNRLGEASPERIRDELFKLLSLDKAGRGLRVAQRLGLLPQVAPGLRQVSADAWTSRLHVIERVCAIRACISQKRSDNTAAAFDLGMLVIQFDRFRSQLQERMSQSASPGRKREELLALMALLHDPDAAESNFENSARQVCVRVAALR